MDSPKKAQLSKAVLNVTTYNQVPGDEYIEYPQATTIDISDLLDKNGVDHIEQINGVSFCEKAEEGYPVLMRYMVDNGEMDKLGADIYDIIDAAIVNEKQSKAIKKLIKDRFDHFSFKHWEKIRSGDIM